MISVSASTPLTFLRRVNGNLQRIPALFNTALPRQVTKVRVFAKERLRKKPGRPRYPIRWTSERQRRFVMAKLSRENNLPYRRTDRMINAWEVDVSFTGENGVITLTNPSEAAYWVVGAGQQGFHKDTGWYKVDNEIVVINAYAVDSIEQMWITVSDPFAGVPQT